MNGHAVGGITNGACRRFINESFATFQKTPKGIDAQFVDDSQRLDLTRCSEQFRSHLRRLADAVSSAAEQVDIEGEGTSDSASLEQDYDLLYSIEKSWHICEIFTINPTKTLSIELVKWLKEICYPPSLASPLERFLQLDEPESVTTQSSGTLGYWEVLYSLIMQGNLSIACELLQLHSEIAAAPASGPAGAITQAQCRMLVELLSTHPFASLASGSVPSLQQPGGSVSAEFSSWQHRVRKLRQSELPLLAGIPELDAALRILLGEAAALDLHSGIVRGGEWAWGKLAIAQLLYVHPPPLGQQDLSRVLEECMHRALGAGPGSNSSSTINSLEHGYVRTLREVMAGNVGPTLRSLYQLSRTGGAASGELVAVVPLLCTAHLALLLVGSLGSEDILLPLQSGANETSFFEEVFLEAAQRLCAVLLCPEVVVGYLGLCPMRGREFARALLPGLAVHSDRSVRAIALLLSEALGWSEEGRALLRARGMWWLTRSAAVPLRAGQGEGEQQLYSSRLAKAATFFLEAGDLSRLCALVEGSLSRCMWAVRSSAEAFPGLQLCPTATGPSRDAMRSVDADSRTDVDRMLELEGSLQEAKELLQTVESIAPEGAEGALAALSAACSCLRGYAAAVQARCTPEGSTEGMRTAARRLAGLIVAEGAHEPALPTRHWLHVLELIAWLCNCIAGAEGEEVGADVTTQYGSMEVEGTASARVGAVAAAVFSKAQAYALLIALQELQTSYGAQDLIASASSSIPGAAGASGAPLLQGLKLGLLGVLCASLVADNAERCSNKAEDSAFAKVGSFACGAGVDSAAQTGFSYRRRRAQAPAVGPLVHMKRGGDSNVQQTMAYELLTGAYTDM